MRMQPHHTRRRSLEMVWPRMVLRKWFNLSGKGSDFGADTDNDDFDDHDDDDAVKVDVDTQVSDNFPRLRRRNSTTYRAQYINTNEIRICAGTWNVGGKLPPEDLDIEEWLNVNEPADIYVLGLQEIVPLNAGNIFGAEDNRPILLWENIIRDTLGGVHRTKSYKSYSDPPSPSKFKPSDDVLDFEDEVLLESDSDGEEEVHPIDEEPGYYEVKDESVCGPGLISITNEVINGDEDLRKQLSAKRLDRLRCFQSNLRDEFDENAAKQITAKLNRTMSGTERIGLGWPEPPLNLLAQHVLERPYSFKSNKSFKTTKSFKTYNSFKIGNDLRRISDASALAELDLESLVQRRRRPEYVRIVSKQMIGVFLTIWVRRRLRKYIQNLKVSTVGVGVMGYIGNKGSVSVSMTIHQTHFCFICTHLTSGEKEVDQLKRNADVLEIHRRTHFDSDGLGGAKHIYNHERIIWLGDLNYRINLPYEETRKLISNKEWSKLIEKDQLAKEQKKGHVFDGWREGELNFPPTYKYEMNSDNYVGEEPKPGRRIPAWCDRILSFGNGMKLLSYRRSELKLSDHRPVTAIYDVDVEVFSPKKLQRALTFTNAEIENEELLIEAGMNAMINQLQVDEASNCFVYSQYEVEFTNV